MSVQEKQIGETFIFPLDGRKVKCVEVEYAICENCILYEDKYKPIDNCDDFVGFCQSSFRKDKKDVIFKIE